MGHLAGWYSNSDPSGTPCRPSCLEGYMPSPLPLACATPLRSDLCRGHPHHTSSAGQSSFASWLTAEPMATNPGSQGSPQPWLSSTATVKCTLTVTVSLSCPPRQSPGKSEPQQNCPHQRPLGRSGGISSFVNGSWGSSRLYLVLPAGRWAWATEGRQKRPESSAPL